MEEFLVVTDIDDFDEDIHYCGLSEVEAYKKFKRIKGRFRKINIIKVVVEKELVKDIPFIMGYEVIEILK